MAGHEGRATGDYATRRGFEGVREPMSTSERGEQGITLVEMLVSIVILGILFSAVAAALINFSTASLNNERRVQATGFMSSVHERLQTIPWDYAVLYEDELNDIENADVEGFEFGARTFEDEDLVLISGPDPDRDDDDLVPEPYVEDGNYRIFTFVTHSEDVVSEDGGDHKKAKRFTTIVEWDVLGRTGTQRFQSLRAPSLANIMEAAPPEVQLFDVSPTSIALDPEPDPALGLADGTSVTAQPASVVAVFSKGVDSAQIIYEDSDGGTESIPLTADPSSITDTAEYTRWTGSLGVGSGPFVDEASLDQPLKLRGVSLAGDEPTQARDLSFSTTFSLDPPVVNSASAAPSEVYVYDDAGTVRLCTELVVQATVSGLDLADPDKVIVRATYVGDGGKGTPLEAKGELVGTNDSYELSFGEDSTSPWDPSGPGAGNAISVAFNVRAVNPGDVSSEIVSTNSVSIRRQGGGGGTC